MAPTEKYNQQAVVPNSIQMNIAKLPKNNLNFEYSRFFLCPKSFHYVCFCSTIRFVTLKAKAAVVSIIPQAQ
jgi:hypothetical protein